VVRSHLTTPPPQKGQRHAALSERAELEEQLRSQHEELEALRLQVVREQWEADRMRELLREHQELAARDAERMQHVHSNHERAVGERRRLEEAAAAERRALHEERQQLELRLQDECERAQRAIETAERLKGEGLLSRLFTKAADSVSPPTSRAGPSQVRTGGGAGLTTQLRQSPTR